MRRCIPPDDIDSQIISRHCHTAILSCDEISYLSKIFTLACPHLLLSVSCSVARAHVRTQGLQHTPVNVRVWPIDIWRAERVPAARRLCTAAHIVAPQHGLPRSPRSPARLSASLGAESEQSVGNDNAQASPPHRARLTPHRFTVTASLAAGGAVQAEQEAAASVQVVRAPYW